MSKKHRLVKIFILLVILVLLMLGFLSIGISCLPFEAVKIKIDAFSLDGKADFFDAGFFSGIVVKLRFLGIMLFVTSCLIYKFRTLAQKFAWLILSETRSFLVLIIHYMDDYLKEEDRTHQYAFLLIFFLGIGIRLAFLFQPVRYDEAFTFLSYASKPLFISLSNYSAPNNQLFHTLLVRLAYLIFGNRLWAFRLPALISGILIVPSSYLLIYSIYNKHAALLTAGIVASSSPLIEYSVNARGYSMICLFFLLILSIVAFLLKNVCHGAWVLFIIFSVMGFYTIPVMLYPFGVVVVWIFLSIIFKKTETPRNLFIKEFVISLLMVCILTFILYVPVIASTGIKSIIGNAYVISKPWTDFWTSFTLSLLSVWNQWNRDMPFILKWLLIAGFFTYVVFHKRLTNYHILIVLSAAIWLVFILPVQRVVPYVRVWLFLLPLYIGLSVSGLIFFFRLIDNKIEGKSPVFFPIFVFILSFLLCTNVVQSGSVLNSNETGALRDAKEMAIFLKGRLVNGDRVLAACPSDIILQYYFDLFDVPRKYLYSDIDSANRILAVVNTTHQQTLRDILTGKGVLLNEGLRYAKVIDITAVRINL